MAEIDKVIKTTQTQLLRYHNDDGSFFGNVDFHIWSNSAYLLIIDYLGVYNEKKNDVVKWIIEHQNDDGSWGNITEKSLGNYRNTLISFDAIQEYASSKQLNKAKEWMNSHSGNKWLDPYTQMFLSIKRKDITIYSPPLLINVIPLELCKLFGKLHIHFPTLFNWSIFLYPSGWTRNALPPLQIVANLRNKSKLDFMKRHLLKKLEENLLKSQLDNGSWFDTVLPTLGVIYALSELGYSSKNQRIIKALNFLNELTDINGHLNRYRLTVWDTSLSIIALKESGVNNYFKEIKKAARFILKAQTKKGGWAFGIYNNLPDNDDTALATLALRKISSDIQLEGLEEAIQRGMKYLLHMQNDDGGWAAFDKNQSNKKPGRIPPYHEEYHHELKDPSTADVTGHVLHTLGKNEKINKSNKKIKSAIRWLQKDQLPFGGWWGRWGLCYIYGTTQTISGLKAIGENMHAKYIENALEWLINIQNDDGGWGEHYSSYYSEKPVISKSTVEHTSWALIALMDCGIDCTSKIIINGITFLLKQQKEGDFPKAYTAAAIDPGKYDLYSLIFPLITLSKYAREISIDV